jgi:hypothetical protein
LNAAPQALPYLAPINEAVN